MSRRDVETAHLSPRQIELAQHRMAVVAEYAKLKHPAQPLTQAYAARLGLKPTQFYRLVRIYRSGGSLAHRGALAARKGRHVDPTLRALISATLEETGPDAPLSAVVADAGKRCEAQGLPSPPVRLLQQALSEARKNREGSAAYPPLVLDRSPLEYNVETPSGPQAAWLTAVIHGPTAKVLGHHVSAGRAGAAEAVQALLDAIGTDGQRGLPVGVLDDAIVLFRDLRREWTPLVKVLSSTGLLIVGPVSERVRSGVAIFRLLGDRIGSYRLRPRLAAGRPSRDGGSGTDLAVVHSAISRALEAHGAVNEVAERVHDERLPRLAAELTALLRC